MAQLLPVKPDNPFVLIGEATAKFETASSNLLELPSIR
jgi:hypothetical protein